VSGIADRAFPAARLGEGDQGQRRPAQSALGCEGIRQAWRVRVIYYWYVANELITFCRIYPKNEKENLSTDEIKTINDELEN
jgi:hypothetical protein